MNTYFPSAHSRRSTRCQVRGALRAFTLVELLAIISVVALLMSIMASGLTRTNVEGKSIRCINNQRQLMTAWRMYAADNTERVIYNLLDAQTEIANHTYRNWVNNVLSWDGNSMNTNVALLRLGILAPYHGTNASLYKCTADNYVSSLQMALGWTGRTRSVSMSAFFGPYTVTTSSSQNVMFAGYRQWLRIPEVLHPANTWVLIEEHPDSINDGYFVVQPTGGVSWTDIPGSLHDGGCTLGFVDGHVEVHRWLSKSSKLPVRFLYSAPIFDSLARIDSQWLASRTAEPYR